VEILRIENLKKQFNNLPIIDNLNLNIENNCIYGFLGQNGAGKTTTMKMILGLLKPDSGSIYVCNDLVIYGDSKTNQHIGYLPDVPEFYNYMTPKEYLNLCGEVAGIPIREAKRKSNELLDMVGLGTYNRKISGFSRGMKQRLGIAGALIHEPKLLICDEPTSALDPVGRKEILDILLQLKDKTTVLFSTHILSDVEKICDNVAILHNGNLKMNGNLNELKELSRHDLISIEFHNYEDVFRMSDIIKSIESVTNTKVTENIITVKVDHVEIAGRLILQVLVEHNMIIRKYEILEPSLENLFMEVVV
jgi:ABC-2 type transport system ATP-binding protein